MLENLPMALCLCVCVLLSTTVLSQASKTTSCRFFLFAVCVRDDSVYDSTPSRQHSKCTCEHVSPHASLSAYISPVFFFLSRLKCKDICSPSQHTTSEWCCFHLSNVDFSTTCFYCFSLLKHAASPWGPWLTHAGFRDRGRAWLALLAGCCLGGVC